MGENNNNTATTAPITNHLFAAPQLLLFAPPGERYDPNTRSGARWQIKIIFKILDKSSSNMV